MGHRYSPPVSTLGDINWQTTTVIKLIILTFLSLGKSCDKVLKLLPGLGFAVGLELFVVTISKLRQDFSGMSLQQWYHS